MTQASNEKLILHIILNAEFPEGLEVEYKFHPERKWRFDYAYPKKKIAFEYEGLFSRKSRHTTKSGYTEDCRKYNAAIAMGWKIFRITAPMMNEGATIDLMREVLK